MAKFFILGVPHTQTTARFSSCPFTMKTRMLCRMMRRLGHEVVYLGVEGAEVECSEQVAVVPAELWERTFGDPGAEFYNTRTDGPYEAYHRLYASETRRAIDQRVSRPWEAIVCATWGGSQRWAVEGLLCPTQYVEPLGNVAIEAAMSGTPVIATDWGGFTETVLHGQTGFRCRTMDQFVWAARHLDRIQPSVCREWAERNFSPERIAGMFDEYFRMLMDLAGDGWYAERPERDNLDWLGKRWPTEG